MRMEKWSVVGCAALCMAFLAGCSLSFGNVETIKGKDAIKISAEQPPKPVRKAPELRKARIVGEKIEITEKVMFEVNEAAIEEESHELLQDVAAVIAEHADITKIRIEGHTDADGSSAYNKDLSQRRATAVMEFLTDLGVDEARMEAVGYGEEKPIADNETAEGKEKNRRVEFNILGRGRPTAIAKPVEK